jgi:hypothetical protein
MTRYIFLPDKTTVRMNVLCGVALLGDDDKDECLQIFNAA